MQTKKDFGNGTNLKHFGKAFPKKKVAWTNKLKGNLIQKMHDTA